MPWCRFYGIGVHTALHYLDNFLVLGRLDQPSCGRTLSTTLALCEELGFPVAEDKTEGPTTVLTFLGIEIDTWHQQIPRNKLGRLSTTIAAWVTQSETPTTQNSGKKRDLLSIPRQNCPPHPLVASVTAGLPPPGARRVCLAEWEECSLHAVAG